MSLTQQLLVRALIAWFWKRAVHAARRSAGARSCTIGSCCRISSRAISRDVLDDLQPRRLSRSKPNGSRRISSSAIPVFGRVSYAGIELELRQAIEPWYVLGEEPGAGGTARYVDSSVERLQVKVDGLIGERYVVDLQRPPRAAAFHRHARRMGRGRALSRLAAAVVPASDDSGAYAAGLRLCRYLDGTLGRRLHLSRRASGRPQLRRRSRSTPTKPRRGARRASSRSAIRRARWRCPRRKRIRSSR